jgi:hypothetical protein
MAPSGNAAPMASAATVFMSIDAFIVSSFAALRLLGTVLARTFSFARASGWWSTLSCLRSTTSNVERTSLAASLW